MEETLADITAKSGWATWVLAAAVASAVDAVLVSLPTPEVVTQVALGPDGIAADTVHREVGGCRSQGR
jgi:3-hydroxyisobutyrate dehydrogenase-like beta-hydroxyacid dehydrogenase